MQPDSFWLTAARSETGYVRANNEDRMAWTRAPFGDVFIVADGMGGYRGGALAAEITVTSLQQLLGAMAPDAENFADCINQCFQQANLEVYRQRNPDDSETSEMGATAVALIRMGGRIRVAHVGDSRAYLLREGAKLRQLTRDHTRIQTLVDAGTLKPEQASNHPDLGALERAMGRNPTVQADISDWFDVLPDDVLLLCSDGLSGYVDDEAIEGALRSSRTPTAAADRLIECALEQGGYDNVTVQLLRYAPSRWWLAAQRMSRPAFLATACIVVVVGLGLDLFAISRQHTADAATLNARLTQANGEINQLKLAAASKASAPCPPAATGDAPAASAAAPDVAAPARSDVHPKPAKHVERTRPANTDASNDAQKTDSSREK
jgi:serine/threonine protein phosphatase PrpC